jgi:glycosyltransferase involved in cell wall biosynthesis
MTAPSISLCMIVKDESRFLGACLASAKTLCTQLIVVDTGSQDDTIEIARAHGADVYEHPWPGHFSQARNISLDYARGDWILILDGDEVLDEETLDHIASMAQPDDGPVAYDFQIVNFSTEEASDESAHFQRQVRLFRNETYHRYAGLIHNQLMDTRTGEGLSGPFLPVRVLHYGYIPSVWAAQNKAKRLTLLERAIVEDPESLFCHYNLANHLKILGDHARALAHYVPCFDGDLSLDWVKMSFFSAAFCANKLGQYELAIECSEKLLDTHPNVADAHLRRAEALMSLQRPDLVIQVLEPIVGHPDLHAFKTETIRFTLPYRLACAFYGVREYEKALAYFLPLAEFTNDETVFTHICLCALHLDEKELALESYQEGIKLAPDDPDWVKIRMLLDQHDSTPQP